MTAIPFASLGPHADVPSIVTDASTTRGGLRHLYLGEDAETWLFLGHACHLDVLAAVETINREDGFGWDKEDLPDAEALEYTYARLVPCPDHGEDGESCDCDWWLDWSGGEDRKANKGKPSYFPVVIWDAS